VKIKWWQFWKWFKRYHYIYITPIVFDEDFFLAAWQSGDNELTVDLTNNPRKVICDNVQEDIASIHTQLRGRR